MNEDLPWLVFGLSGPMAAPLRRQLAIGEQKIIAVSRREALTEGRIEWRQGSLQAPPVLPDAVRGVLSLGPLDAFSQWFADAELKTERVIAIGSMSEVFKRESPIAAERALADTLRRSRELLQATCMDRGSACLVLRPSLVLGAEPGAPDGFSRLCELATRYRIAPVPRPARGLRQPLHRADLADLLLHAMRGPSQNGDFDVGGPQTLRLDDLLATVFAARAPRAVRIPVPMALLGLAKPFLTEEWRAALARAQQDQCVDGRPARRILGWAPTRLPG